MTATQAGEKVASRRLEKFIMPIEFGPRTRIPASSAMARKVLASSGTKRSPFLPDVPTFKEAGVDLISEGWYGLFVNSKAPQD